MAASVNVGNKLHSCSNKIIVDKVILKENYPNFDMIHVSLKNKCVLHSVTAEKSMCSLVFLQPQSNVVTVSPLGVP